MPKHWQTTGVSQNSDILRLSYVLNHLSVYVGCLCPLESDRLFALRRVTRAFLTLALGPANALPDGSEGAPRLEGL